MPDVLAQPVRAAAARAAKQAYRIGLDISMVAGSAVSMGASSRKSAPIALSARCAQYVAARDEAETRTGVTY
jgi:hypothetical protein